MKNAKMVLKVGALVVPVVMAVLTGIYGDVTPMVRSFCEAALPAGALGPEVDAGASPYATR